MFRCFLCQKEGRSPPLRRCSQCEVAYYCSKTCQKGHWKKHKAACIAAVAAKAEDARRERLGARDQGVSWKITNISSKAYEKSSAILT